MERTTNGIRNVMFEELEKYMRGEKTAEHIVTLKTGFSVILATVEKDLSAAKLVAQLRLNKDQPQSVADLNLNLLLGAVDASLAEKKAANEN